jgi:DNA-binding IclR family transcriptional regulator
MRLVGKIVDMTWTFLSNHGNVLVYIDEHRTARLREIADAVGITERATHKLVSELVDEGYLTRKRVGRRSEYSVNSEMHLRQPALARHTLNELLIGMSRPVPGSSEIKRVG